jgi:hypothetical protein
LREVFGRAADPESAPVPEEFRLSPEEIARIHLIVQHARPLFSRAAEPMTEGERQYLEIQRATEDRFIRHLAENVLPPPGRR